MKLLPVIALGVAAIVVWSVITRVSEPFVPEFLELSGVQRTSQMKDSSYEQRTNHMPQPSGTDIPIQGVESPFRVNQFNSWIV